MFGGSAQLLRAAVNVLFMAILPSNRHEDVALVGAALKQLGFEMTILKDADYRAMDVPIKRFISEVRSNGKGAISFRTRKSTTRSPLTSATLLMATSGISRSSRTTSSTSSRSRRRMPRTP